MTTSNQDSSAADLKRVLDMIERLRIQRQQNPGKVASRIQNMKRFTQQELNDEACGTYKNLLTGRSRRLPDRQTLMDIANYLDCTGEERNDLLLSAGYVPIPLPLSGRQLDRVLDQARSMLHQLPYPGMIVTDMLDIVGFNEAFCNLFGLSDFNFASNPPNMIDLHFNEDMPIRAASSFDEKSQARWESHGVVGIQAFKSHHPALFVDPKYARFHRMMDKYAELHEFWDREAWTVEQDLNTAKHFLARQPGSAERKPIRYNQLHLAVTYQAYPRIEFFVPADESARQVFAAWGCATDCSFKSWHFV